MDGVNGVNIVSELANGGGLLMVAWVIWWTFTKTIPGLQHEIKLNTMTIELFGKMLLKHDSTVRGVNTSVSGSHHEMQSMYDDGAKIIDEMRNEPGKST